MPAPGQGWLQDLVTLAEDDGIGTFNTQLFTSSKAAVPKLVGSGTLTFIETGGTSPERTHNAVIRPAIVRPGAQVLARAADYETAKALAHRFYDVVVQVKNQFVNSGWYMDISPRQEPFDPGAPAPDGQAQCIFNIIGKIGKRPW